jgi:hypothetical protein
LDRPLGNIVSDTSRHPWEPTVSVVRQAVRKLTLNVGCGLSQSANRRAYRDWFVGSKTSGHLFTFAEKIRLAHKVQLQAVDIVMLKCLNDQRSVVFADFRICVIQRAGEVAWISLSGN